MAGSGNAHLWQEAGAAVSARNGGPAPHNPAGADAHPNGNALTILTTFGPLATKVLGPGQDGLVTVLEGYGRAEYFRCSTALVHNFADLLALLERLATCRRSFPIRGEPLPGTDLRRC